MRSKNCDGCCCCCCYYYYFYYYYCCCCCCCNFCCCCYCCCLLSLLLLSSSLLENFGFINSLLWLEFCFIPAKYCPIRITPKHRCSSRGSDYKDPPKHCFQDPLPPPPSILFMTPPGEFPKQHFGPTNVCKDEKFCRLRRHYIHLFSLHIFLLCKEQKCACDGNTA